MIEKNDQELKENKPNTLSVVDKIHTKVNNFVQKESVRNFLNNVSNKIDYSIDYITNSKSNKHDGNEVVQSAEGPIKFGFLVIAIFFCTFGLWGGFSPLAEGSHAIGVFVPGANRYPIQHLEGGIIQEIYVKNGDFVKAGDKLLLLGHAGSEAANEHYKEDYAHLLANFARLEAQRDGLDKVTYPKEITEHMDSPEIKTIYDSQEKLFKTTMDGYNETIKIYEAKISSQKKQLDSLLAREESYKKQLEIFKQRYQAIKKLAEKGHASKAQLAEQESKYVQIDGELMQTQQNALATEQQMQQAQAEMSNYKVSFANQIAKEIKENKANMSQTQANFKSSKDAQERRLITASIDGFVHNFFYYSPGGKMEYYRPGSLVSQNSRILDIIPEGEMEVEAKVRPDDIDIIHVGMKCKMHLQAYKMKYVPDIIGEVIYVSKDISIDQSSPGGAPAPYYGVRIVIDKSQYKNNPDLAKLVLYPGMGADVTLISGSKTFFRYLVDPLIKSMKKSFLER